MIEFDFDAAGKIRCGKAGDGPPTPETPLLDGPSSRGISKSRQFSADTREMQTLGLCWYRWKKFYDKVGLKHSLPFVLLVCYSIFGGALFLTIEGPREAALITQEDKFLNNSWDQIIHWRDDLIERFWEVHMEAMFLNHSRVWVRGNLFNALDWYNLSIYELSVNISKSVRDIRDPQWDNFWNAVFYAGTVYTTIGYGNIVPISRTGKILTMVYAFFGIPIMFLVLHKLGRIFCVLLLKMWDLFSKMNRRYCRFCRRRQRRPNQNIHSMISTASPQGVYGSRATTSGRDDSRNSEEVQVKQLYDVPISLAVLITFGWMLMCSGLFMIWEDWSYFDSFYFFFISLTTIGLGDIVPSDLQKMAMVFGVVIIGLSLVTMCINLVQVKLEHAFQESVLMIMKKYQEAQIRGESAQMNESEHKMMDMFNPKEKWLKGLMGRKQKELLMSEWKKRAKMKPKATQTELCLPSDEEHETFHQLATVQVQTDSNLNTDHQDNDSLNRCKVCSYRRKSPHPSEATRTSSRESKKTKDECLSLYFRQNSIDSTTDIVQHVLSVQPDNVPITKQSKPKRSAVSLGIASFFGFGTPVPQRPQRKKLTNELALATSNIACGLTHISTSLATGFSLPPIPPQSTLSTTAGDQSRTNAQHSRLPGSKEESSPFAAVGNCYSPVDNIDEASDDSASKNLTEIVQEIDELLSDSQFPSSKRTITPWHNQPGSKLEDTTKGVATNPTASRRAVNAQSAYATTISSQSGDVVTQNGSNSITSIQSTADRQGYRRKV